jgi:hypothetical protein
MGAQVKHVQELKDFFGSQMRDAVDTWPSNWSSVGFAAADFRCAEL